MNGLRTTAIRLVKNFVRNLVWPYAPARLRALYLARRSPAYYPKCINLEPTTRCNLLCVHCGRTYWKGRNHNRDLDFELCKRILPQLREKGVERLTIQGLGEPLLHKNIFEIIELCHQLGFYTRFNTNLTILTDETAERLVRSGHSEVAVSVESIDPEVFADIRRPTTLDCVLGNLRRLAAAKKRLGATNPDIRVSTVLIKPTLHRVPELVAEMKRLGVSTMNFQDFNTDGIDLDTRLRDGTTLRENTLSAMPEEEVRSILREIKALEDDTLTITIPGDATGRKVQRPQAPGILTCPDLWSNPYSDSAGRMTPCCWLPDGDIMTLGDFNTQTFEEIWLGEAYERLRYQHLTNQHPVPCATCQQLFCTVAAPSRFRGVPKIIRTMGGVFLGKKPARGKRQ